MDLRFGKKKEQEKNPEDEFEELIYRIVMLGSAVAIYRTAKRQKRIYEEMRKRLEERMMIETGAAVVFYAVMSHKGLCVGRRGVDGT